MVFTHHTPKYGAFLKAGRQAVRDKMVETQVEGLPYTGPVELHLKFLVTRPKTTKLLAPHPDIDNFAKAMLDCIQSSKKEGPGIIEDDKQVLKLTAEKSWTEKESCIQIQVRGLPT